MANGYFTSTKKGTSKTKERSRPQAKPKPLLRPVEVTREECQPSVNRLLPSQGGASPVEGDSPAALDYQSYLSFLSSSGPKKPPTPTPPTESGDETLWKHIEDRTAVPTKHSYFPSDRKGQLKPKKGDQFGLRAADRVIEVKCTCEGTGACIYCYTTSPAAATGMPAPTGMEKRKRTLMDNAAIVINTSDQRNAVANIEMSFEKELRKYKEDHRNTPEVKSVIDVWGCGVGAPGLLPVPIRLPPELCKVLKPHQIDGLRFLWKNLVVEPFRRGLTDDSGGFVGEGDSVGCVLAHSMGLGKTAQVVIFLHILSHLKITTHMLILVPKSTMSNWLSEFDTWSAKMGPHFASLALTMLGADKSPKRRDQIVLGWAETEGVLIMSYETYGGLVNAYTSRRISRAQHAEQKILGILQKPGPGIVICDEGHIMRNDQAAISIALKELKTRRRVILTGTPLQNHLSEYWTMVDFVRPGYFPKKEFTRFFQSPILEGQRADAPVEALSLMKKRAFILLKELEPFVHRRDQKILQRDLPPKHEYVVFCPLTSLQKKAYKCFRESYVNCDASEFHGSVRSSKSVLYYMSVLAKLGAHPDLLRDALLNKAKRFYEGEEDATRMSFDWAKGVLLSDAYEPNRIRESPKIMMLMYVVEYCMKAKEKLLVFSQYTQTLDLLERFLKILTKGRASYRLDGHSSDADRARSIKGFQCEPGFSVFFISVRAGGVGINLNSATKCVLFDVSFNPALDQQAMFRCYRYGQHKPVTIYRLVSEGTPESQIFSSCISKEWMAKKLVDNEVPSRSYVRGVGFDGLYEDLQEQIEKEYTETSEMGAQLEKETAHCLQQNALLAHITSQLAKRQLNFKRVFRHESLLMSDMNEAAGQSVCFLGDFRSFFLSHTYI